MQNYFHLLTARKFTWICVQLYSRYDYSREYLVVRMNRDEKITKIYKDASEVLKMEIKRNLLK